MPDSRSTLTLDDDCVVVAGFGPVGAVAALALALRGVPVVVIEAADHVHTDPSESRASTFHPPTLEMLDDVGVLDELLSSGLVAPTYQMRDRQEGVIAHFDLTVLAEDTKFPFRLQNEQQNLVAIVERKLHDLPNVRMIFGAPLEKVEVTGERCQLELGGEDPQTVDARWVIAADGSNSAARRSLNIDFPGLTYPERFLVISTTYPMHEPLPGVAPVNYVSDASEWFVLLQTPRHWRVLFPAPGHDDAATLQAPEAVEARMQRVAPIEGRYPISHTTLYNVHQRVAAAFRVGPLLLAGDAGHINNPLGGMGMNSGIHDAFAAVEAITRARAGDIGALDEYSTVRRDAAMNYVQKATHRNWEQLQEHDPAVRRERNNTMRRIAADPELAREFLLTSSMLGARRTSVGPETHATSMKGTP